MEVNCILSYAQIVQKWLYGEAQGRTDQDQITHVMRNMCAFHISVLWHFTIWNMSICLVWTQIQEWIHTRYSIGDQNLMAPERYMSLLSFLESVSIDRINTILYLTRCRMRRWIQFQDGDWNQWDLNLPDSIGTQNQQLSLRGNWWWYNMLWHVTVIRWIHLTPPHTFNIRQNRGR